MLNYQVLQVFLVFLGKLRGVNIPRKSAALNLCLETDSHVFYTVPRNKGTDSYKFLVHTQYLGILYLVACNLIHRSYYKLVRFSYLDAF